ncbi:MAG: hypothetical protein ACRDPH_06040 [Marmoricola sp.]
MPDPDRGVQQQDDRDGPPARSRLNQNLGRVLVFVYGVMALSATGRSSVQLSTKFSEAPVAYALSGLAAVVYILATWGLATERRRVAWVAVTIEMVGVLAVGTTSVFLAQDYADATVWSDYGDGYGWVPLVLPMLGLWWLWHTRPRDRDAPAAE